MSADPRRMCIVQGGRDVETDSRKESPGRCSLHRVHRWTAGARSRSCVLGAGELSFLPSLFGGHVGLGLLAQNTVSMQHMGRVCGYEQK